MAGLRWWNYVNDEGQSVWNFESSSAEDQIKFSKAEIQIFWFGLIIFPVIWVRLIWFSPCNLFKSKIDLRHASCSQLSSHSRLSGWFW